MILYFILIDLNVDERLKLDLEESSQSFTLKGLIFDGIYLVNSFFMILVDFAIISSKEI